MYFQQESIETVGQHIMALFGAKIFAYIKNEKSLDINLERETADGAVYIHTSRPGVSNVNGPNYEEKIDAKYLDSSNAETAAFRLESYRSFGTVSSTHSTTLRCYFIRKCEFVKPNPTPEEMTDIRLVSDKVFLGKAAGRTLELYQVVMNNVLKRRGPVIEKIDVPNSREKRLVIGFKYDYY
jgi:glutamate dehydrogenase